MSGGPAPRYLSVHECAALLAVNHKTVRRLIKCKKLPALHVGRVWRITRPTWNGCATTAPRRRPPAGADPDRSAGSSPPRP